MSYCGGCGGGGIATRVIYRDNNGVHDVNVDQGDEDVRVDAEYEDEESDLDEDTQQMPAGVMRKKVQRVECDDRCFKAVQRGVFDRLQDTLNNMNKTDRDDSF
jgi:hypothetical protein